MRAAKGPSEAVASSYLLGTSSPKEIPPFASAGGAAAGSRAAEQAARRGAAASDDESASSSSRGSFTSDLQMSAIGVPAAGRTASPPSPKQKSRMAPPEGDSAKKGGVGREAAPSAGVTAAAAARPQPPAPAPAAAAAAPATHQRLPKEKTGGPPPEEIKKKPELTKAERRAIQEAQRAAKAGGGGGGAGAAGAPKGGAAAPKPDTRAGPGQQKGVPGMPRSDSFKSERGHHHPGTSTGGGAPSGEAAASSSSASASGGAAQKASTAPPHHHKKPTAASAELFSHLPQYKSVSVSSLLSHQSKDHHHQHHHQHQPSMGLGSGRGMHPAVLQLGLRYADGTISGANARCMAMLHTLCQVIMDYTTPGGKSLSRDLTQQLNAIVNFIVECRPLSVSMGNAIKHIKMKLSKIDPSKPEAEAKEELVQDISDFIQARIRVAGQEIVNTSVDKVVDLDVILTFAYSHVVASALLEAARRGQKRFRVIVVDARPELEGRLMMDKLLGAGLACSYVHINAVSYAMREATKVFLGAAAIMSNGTVMGRAGTAIIGMVAHEHRKPVLVLCESYKFHERVQLDSITHNELGDPEALATVLGRPDVTALSLPIPPSPAATAAAGGADAAVAAKRPGLLNLKYDAMPADYVSAIVTEFGLIPPSSVPVILRECRGQEV